MADNQQGSSECEAPTGRAKHYISGGCAGIASTMIVFPIKKTVFRQQVFGVRTSEAIRQLQRDGMRTLYRGLLPPLLEKTTSAAIMFGFYEDMSRWLPQPAGSPGLLTNSMAAVLAGTAEATMTPFNRVQALLQDQRNHSRFNNTFHTFRTLVRDYGVRELYRGMGPILLQNGPYNVLFFGLRGPMKRSLPVAETHVGHLVNDFICGGILGASLNFLFYPLKCLYVQNTGYFALINW
ncbi:mitochondrial nicotinamide adenine dinucleotide transporter SLC25A51-like isoform X2 [Paramormyrops kingsleyae]|uniref:mitochondrial nicotinamide adenine dinucleotide transporter SLC25A51-like isoform X2 n=1 Tax=Paramormyrops kingsleyae TaxID=1676925 RepID=UPI003B970C18